VEIPNVQTSKRKIIYAGKIFPGLMDSSWDLESIPFRAGQVYKGTPRAIPGRACLFRGGFTEYSKNSTWPTGSYAILADSYTQFLHFWHKPPFLVISGSKFCPLGHSEVGWHLADNSEPERSGCPTDIVISSEKTRGLMEKWRFNRLFMVIFYGFWRNNQHS